MFSWIGSIGRLQSVNARKPSSIDTLVSHSISLFASAFSNRMRWTSVAMCPLGPPTTTSYLGFQFITYYTRSMSQELYQYIECLTSASQNQNISEIHTKSQEKACSLLSNNTLQTPIETATDFSLKGSRRSWTLASLAVYSTRVAHNRHIWHLDDSLLFIISSGDAASCAPVAQRHPYRETLVNWARDLTKK